MKNCNDTIGNRTRDLPACSAVPQPNAAPRVLQQLQNCVIPLLDFQGSSVDVATRYGLDGPGIESRWRRDFPYPSRAALGRTQPPMQWVPSLSRG